MARTLNPETHALRRDAFVEVAQRLIATKGYEQLSIQDVLDELGASKGAFYHYFDSKQALLAAVVERTVEVATATIEPIVADPLLPAREKLEGVFSGIAQWKGERSVLMLELARVWFSDDNIIVRERMRRAVAERLTPLLATIVRQGMAEGDFATSSAEGAADVLVSLVLGLNEVASRLFLERRANRVTFEEAEITIAAYVEGIERVLGLAAGTLALGDRIALQQWFG